MNGLLITLVSCVFLLVLGVVFYLYRTLKKGIDSQSDNLKSLSNNKNTPTQVTIDTSHLEGIMKDVTESIKGMPNKLLQSIQASSNTKKGALGELIGYIQLEAEYDRIIPLGNIVDFMCIKFPSHAKTGMNPHGIIEEGRVDFVDIKTGKSSRLSKDQKMLQELIKEKKINFIKVNVSTQGSESKSK